MSKECNESTSDCNILGILRRESLGLCVSVNVSKAIEAGFLEMND